MDFLCRPSSPRQGMKKAILNAFYNRAEASPSVWAEGDAPTFFMWVDYQAFLLQQNGNAHTPPICVWQLP